MRRSSTLLLRAVVDKLHDCTRRLAVATKRKQLRRLSKLRRCDTAQHNAQLRRTERLCRATASLQQLWQTRNKKNASSLSAVRRHVASQQRTHSTSALTLPSHRHAQRTRLQQQPRLTRKKRISKRALCFVWPQQPCRALHV